MSTISGILVSDSGAPQARQSSVEAAACKGSSASLIADHHALIM